MNTEDCVDLVERKPESYQH